MSVADAVQNEEESFQKLGSVLEEFEDAERNIFGAEFFPNENDVALDDSLLEKPSTDNKDANQGADDGKTKGKPILQTTLSGNIIKAISGLDLTPVKVVPITEVVQSTSHRSGNSEKPTLKNGSGSHRSQGSFHVYATVTTSPRSNPPPVITLGLNTNHGLRDGNSSVRSSVANSVPHTGRSGSGDKTNAHQSSSERRERSLRTITSARMVAGANLGNVPLEATVLPAVTPSASIGIGQMVMNMNGNSLRLNTGNIKTAHLGQMMSIIQDPIQCGYMLHFCQSEHNSENLCFIMMVSRFRDAMSTDYAAWPKTWLEIDAEVDGKDVGDVPWPSKRLQHTVIQKLVQSIWDNFLSDDAITQICMRGDVAAHTKRRVGQLNLYGPEVFSEALLDPINTMYKDVLPRFLASSLYQSMTQRLLDAAKPRLASSLKVPPPNYSALLEGNESFNEKRLFTLKEIMEDMVLYPHLLMHLEKALSSENLLCVRMINIFEELAMDENEEVQANNHAWIIYRYFVAPGAPFEVSLHSRHKKELMISLAKPYPQMFDELKKSALGVLTVNFNAFKFTDEYRNMWRVIHGEKSKMGNMTNRFSKFTFF